MKDTRITAQTRRPERLRRLAGRVAEALRSDRGDVPGWVLITLMTAGIVVALWAVASDALIGLFNQAIAQFG
ncbi:hypothetical protein M3A96_04835 [Helcobacillus massiliensis]|uniref:Uncharacterized protein n=1 Tax=Helcobacillus massiliensis TaxID=521392 RepID=A0A839QQF3_9MICO|nr:MULTISPECIES: hypothetical protein [Helcobacillus]MBB3022005.1 hypothetical protein [Helcobacillus massiliensis]MCG7426899.1 hypothetical protein [Helcobacillus sp. ACRRO]MCT1557439.1 hypothetical protein [Helcobacillus massiliensis]MCT2036380.1 hypothetical protein [Helcobacillus massiliensis]MCT2331878.1 hypothetical protein [Helcobacillus massiliensis]